MTKRIGMFPMDRGKKELLKILELGLKAIKNNDLTSIETDFITPNMFCDYIETYGDKYNYHWPQEEEEFLFEEWSGEWEIPFMIDNKEYSAIGNAFTGTFRIKANKIESIESELEDILVKNLIDLSRRNISRISCFGITPVMMLRVLESNVGKNLGYSIHPTNFVLENVGSYTKLRILLHGDEFSCLWSNHNGMFTLRKKQEKSKKKMKKRTNKFC